MVMGVRLAHLVRHSGAPTCVYLAHLLRHRGATIMC